MIVEQEGNTVDEAVEKALKKLNVPREKVKIEIISEGKKGVFGLGGQVATVRVTTIGEEDRQAPVLKESRIAPTSQKEPVGEFLEAMSPGTEFLQEVFKSLGIEAKFRTLTTEAESQVIDIITSDGALLIGKKGKNLEALQYLVNIAVNRGTDKKVRVLLDVEGYRGRREETLIALAKKVADEVRQAGMSVSLEPMSAYERRLVHLALKEDPDITTESTGEGEERRIVIKTREGS